MPQSSESYNLYVLRPDLAKQWHPTKNGSLSPKDVSPGSSREVWWLCEHGHWWLASVRDRTRAECTFCRESIKRGEQRISFKAELRRMASHPQWRYLAVISRPPSKVGYGGSASGAEWKAAVPCRLAENLPVLQQADAPTATVKAPHCPASAGRQQRPADRGTAGRSYEENTAPSGAEVAANAMSPPRW
jgi:hypothetical protein